MKFDPSMMRYLTRDEWRTLTAIELGMKNHELVPTTLIVTLARLKHGGAKKAIEVLHKNKLLWHSGAQYDGYRLTYPGYDFLALKALAARGTVIGTGRQIGVGKESDIFMAYTEEGKEIALKIHRLGRTSFRTIKNNRDYLQHRKSASWMYMSRLAALKEYAFMKALYDHKFPVPTPIDANRHCVLMSLVNAYPLNQVRKLEHPAKVYTELMNLIIRLAQYGLIHCDFNEFNLLINDNEEITLIDFPQMVSTSHANAEMYFNRDVECIKTFFSKRFDFNADTWPIFTVDTEKKYSLDVAISASGFSKENQAEFDRISSVLEQSKSTEDGKDESDSDDDDNEDSSDDDNEKPEQVTDDSVKKIIPLTNNTKDGSDEEKPVDNEAIEKGEDETNTETGTDSDSEETDADFIKNRVKKTLAKKSRPKVKRNQTKTRQKRENRDIIKHH